MNFVRFIVDLRQPQYGFSLWYFWLEKGKYVFTKGTKRKSKVLADKAALTLKHTHITRAILIYH